MTSVRALFLDRDGVINPNVLNPATGQWESPHHVRDFSLFPGTLPALQRIAEAGYRLFLVSNQPSFAKGKTSLENILEIKAALEAQLKSAGIVFTEHYYCYSHPDSIVPGYGLCECRKPSPYFLFKAQESYGIDLSQSWMVGDRVSDIRCGKAAGTRTILINDTHTEHQERTAAPDCRCAGLPQAVDHILNACS